jgi:hypothetical protein
MAIKEIRVCDGCGGEGRYGEVVFHYDARPRGQDATWERDLCPKCLDKAVRELMKDEGAAAVFKAMDRIKSE